MLSELVRYFLFLKLNDSKCDGSGNILGFDLTQSQLLWNVKLARLNLLEYKHTTHNAIHCFLEGVVGQFPLQQHHRFSRISTSSPELFTPNLKPFKTGNRKSPNSSHMSTHFKNNFTLHRGTTCSTCSTCVFVQSTCLIESQPWLIVSYYIYCLSLIFMLFYTTSRKR